MKKVLLIAIIMLFQTKSYSEEYVRLPKSEVIELAKKAEYYEIRDRQLIIAYKESEKLKAENDEMKNKISSLSTVIHWMLILIVILAALVLYFKKFR
jgi:hypothetical protein